MNYIEYKFSITPVEPWREVLLALLSECNFESFVEQTQGLDAYVKVDQDQEDAVLERISVLNEATIQFTKSEIQQENWNQTWESNFTPILVSDQCLIRAEFHETVEDIPYEIIIQPKMSFGTGHHATTHLMVEFLLENDCKDLSVLDMGCGTSILAILALKLGASDALGIDIDEWAVENSIENANRNHVVMEAIEGDVNAIPKKEFDVILANINKNILMADMPEYVNAMKQNGSDLYLSGILDTDFNDILDRCTALGLEFVKKKERQEWIALHFKKH